MPANVYDKQLFAARTWYIEINKEKYFVPRRMHTGGQKERFLPDFRINIAIKELV